MKIIADNFSDQATLSATPAMSTTLPVTNLQNQYREQVARTTSTASQLITVTWATSQPISGCVLYRTNLTSAATWRVRVYDTPSMGSLLYDSGTVKASLLVRLGDLRWGIEALGASYYDQWDHCNPAVWFPTVRSRYVKIDINDAANPDGYIEASRLFCGFAFEPGVNPDYGMQMSWNESTRQVRTDGGTLRSEPGYSYRSLNVSLKMLEELDRATFTEMMRRIGLRSDIFVSVFPGEQTALERDNQMQAKLRGLSPTEFGSPLRYDQSVKFEEL